MVIVVVAMIILGMMEKTTAASDTDTMPLVLPICVSSLSVTRAQGSLWAKVWIVLLVFDLTVLALTVAKALTMRESVRYGLFRVLFRDGAIYAGLLLLLGTVNVVTFMVPQIPDHYRGIATTFTNVISVTLVSRIVLNLRDPAVHGRIQRLTHRPFAFSMIRSPEGESAEYSDTQTVRALSFRALRPAESDQEEEDLSPVQRDNPHIRESLDVRMSTVT
ncbi:hypothetical protein C8Q73DRAFT_832581 [Cubamyces lactineus]|nr:hypothetical protein C8Q73DRAFT_832581 [Cubamyces lactineus]